MRWNTRKPEPKENDTRLIHRFLFVPRKINDEWRWLERAQIQQEWVSFNNYHDKLEWYWRDRLWYV